jgi:hypothetical protein
MAASTSSVVIAEAVVEDEIADIWPDYPCLYDVWSPDFKNREMRENSVVKIAEKRGKTGMLCQTLTHVCANAMWDCLGIIACIIISAKTSSVNCAITCVLIAWSIK